MSDSRLYFDAEGHLPDDLRALFDLGFRPAPWGKALSWSTRKVIDEAIRNRLSLIFHWHNAEGASPFPVPVDSATAAWMATCWLADRRSEDFGPAPQTDGSVERGFRVWTHTRTASDYGIVAVQPHWIIIPK